MSAQAIDWATNECNAHIISISFGYEDDDYLIEMALQKAIHSGKLIIAAASNNGGISGRTRPARREGVLCIHATDGKGNKGKMNPSPLSKSDNFATLSVAVPLTWKGAAVWKSGTSFSVPIAVGFAADVLEFALYKCRNIAPHKLKILYQKRGMEAIFRKMAEERDGYDFIHPCRLWEDWEDCGDAAAKAKTARIIEEILGYL
ncbi:hypothetical protein IL306_009843 [Fusarium sp. DS 682]|nr:hypothetical protein IL306_009843 [Fusarium sp. DS 682]